MKQDERVGGNGDGDRERSFAQRTIKDVFRAVARILSVHSCSLQGFICSRPLQGSDLSTSVYGGCKDLTLSVYSRCKDLLLTVIAKTYALGRSLQLSAWGGHFEK